MFSGERLHQTRPVCPFTRMDARTSSFQIAKRNTTCVTQHDQKIRTVNNKAQRVQEFSYIGAPNYLFVCLPACLTAF